MTQKKVVLMEFEGNSNIGLYMFANDKFCILGKEITKDKKKEIEKILEVPIYHATTLGTELIGVFVSGDNQFLLIPEMYDFELNIFKKIAKEHNMKLICIKEIQNTFGNNICFGDKTILLNSNYSNDFKKKIEKETKYKSIEIEHSDFENVGAICIYKNNKYFLSQEIKESQVKKIAKQVGGIGTINSGSNFITSGVVGNSNGILIGSSSSTVEIQNIVESLDYI